jgi:hypothetical protein
VGRASAPCTRPGDCRRPRRAHAGSQIAADMLAWREEGVYASVLAQLQYGSREGKGGRAPATRVVRKGPLGCSVAQEAARPDSTDVLARFSSSEGDEDASWSL